MVTRRMGVVVWGALSRAPHYCQLNTHLVTHHETYLSHCLDGHLGSTYSGRYGRFVRERAQGSTLGWFISTGKYGDSGGGRVIGENSLLERESGHSSQPRGVYVQGDGGSMRPQ